MSPRRAEARLTPRGHGVAALAAGLIAAGAVAGPQFRGQTLAAWGFAVLVFLLAYRAFFAARAAAAVARLERRLLTRPSDGASFEVGLRVCSSLPSGVDLVVEDEAPPGMERLSPPRGAVPAVPGGCAELAYRLRGRPGRHRWGKTRITARDWLGLLTADLGRATPRGVSETRVAPKPARIAGRALGWLVAAAASTTGLRGSGTVFLELREYMPDDDSRLIDWKSSARTGKLLVKVFEKETRGRILVIADLACGLWGVPGHTLAEAAARVAAGAVSWAARQGEEVALLALLPDGGVAATGWLRGPTASRAAAALLSSIQYGASGVAGAASCSCPPVPARRLAARLGPRRPAVAVLVSPLGGGCRGRAGELEELARVVRAARIVRLAAIPRPPEGLETVYKVRAAAVTKAAGGGWLVVWDTGAPVAGGW